MVQVELDATIAAVFTVVGNSSVEEVLQVTTSGDVHRTALGATAAAFLPVVALRAKEPVASFDTAKEAIRFAARQSGLG